MDSGAATHPATWPRHDGHVTVFSSANSSSGRGGGRAGSEQEEEGSHRGLYVAVALTRSRGRGSD
eukprot:2092043-Rhodomonas_salina.2